MAKRGYRLWFVVLLAMALSASQLFADSVPVVWVDASGNWSTASKWSPAVVPNNGGGTTYTVTATGPLGAPSIFIGVDISPTVDSLSLGPGVQVGVGSGSTLTTGTLSTSGFV